MIRYAKITDGPAITRLLDQLEYPDTQRFMSARLHQLLNDPSSFIFVWESLGQPFPIAGFLSLYLIPQIGKEGDFARISYFAIDESSRSEGIGRQLEEYATRLAREKGCELIEVHCHTRRTRAHAFYFRQGYEESPKYLIKRLK